MAATRARTFLTVTKQALLNTALFRSSAVVPNSLLRIVTISCLQRGASVSPTRNLSSQPATSSLHITNSKSSETPSSKTDLVDGCDFKHWLVVLEPPEDEATRDEIINRYIDTLSSVLKNESEQQVRKRIYSVSTKHYFAFGAQVDEDTSYALKNLPPVRWVLPDSYVDLANKEYGGEPFINGEAVPYDPKYHEQWVKNNAALEE